MVFLASIASEWNTYVLHTMHGLGYDWWSGPGSDLGQLTLISSLVAIYWQHTCHIGWCPWWARHHVEGTPYKVCRKHHPTLPNDRITVAHVHEAHTAHAELRAQLLHAQDAATTAKVGPEVTPET